MFIRNPLLEILDECWPAVAEREMARLQVSRTTLVEGRCGCGWRAFDVATPGRRSSFGAAAYTLYRAHEATGCTANPDIAY